MLAAAIVAIAIISSTFLQLSANKKRKKKNSDDKQTKKRNGANYFITINVIKKKDNNKKEAKIRTFAKATAIIVAATFKVNDIYKDDTWGLVLDWLYKLVFCGGIFFIFLYKSSLLWWNQQLSSY